VGGEGSPENSEIDQRRATRFLRGYSLSEFGEGSTFGWGEVHVGGVMPASIRRTVVFKGSLLGQEAENQIKGLGNGQRKEIASGTGRKKKKSKCGL